MQGPVAQWFGVWTTDPVSDTVCGFESRPVRCGVWTVWQNVSMSTWWVLNRTKRYRRGLSFLYIYIDNGSILLSNKTHIYIYIYICVLLDNKIDPLSIYIYKKLSPRRYRFVLFRTHQVDIETFCHTVQTPQRTGRDSNPQTVSDTGSVVQTPNHWATGPCMSQRVPTPIKARTKHNATTHGTLQRREL